MAQRERAAYYRALKRAGYTFDRHYREYKLDELKKAWEIVAEREGITEPVEVPEPSQPPLPSPQDRGDEIQELKNLLNGAKEAVAALAKMLPAKTPNQAKPRLDPNQHAGVTLNTHAEHEVIEVDQYGNKWLQKEVAKPAFPKPRGRRILRYDDPGVRTEQVKVGEYIETFEVADDSRTPVPSEVKITLPSFQTGIYLSPEFPWRIHTYQGARGFNLFDVQEYYGGSDLVPDTIKRCYVSNDLCYDISSTIRAVENEFRERVLKSERGL